MRLREYRAQLRLGIADADAEWLWTQSGKSSVKEAAPVSQAVAPWVETDQRCDDDGRDDRLTIGGMGNVPQTARHARVGLPLAKDQRLRERDCYRQRHTDPVAGEGAHPRPQIGLPAYGPVEADYGCRGV